MFARIIDWSIGNRLLVVLGTLAIVVAGGVLSLPHTHRRHPGPLRRPGHHPDGIPRAGAAHRRGPGHLSPHDADAVGAVRAGGARVLVLRRVVRVRDLRGRDRPLLGQEPRPRVSELHLRAASGGRHAQARTRRDRRRLGLHVRAQLRPPRPRRAALDPGLVPEVRADDRPRGLRSCQRGGLRAAVPGHRRPEQAACVQPSDLRYPHRHSGQQQRCRRRPDRGRREGVHDPGTRVHQVGRRPAPDRSRGGPRRHPDSAAGRGQGEHGTREPPRIGGMERGRRDGRRHRRSAPRRGHPPRDPRREGQAGRGRAGTSGGCGDRGRLRPHVADRPRCGEHSDEPGPAVADRGTGVPRLPVPPAERTRGRDRAAGGYSAGDDRGAASGTDPQHHVAGRDRRRDRDDGRRRDRDGRERAQAPRETRGPQAALGDHRQCGKGSRPVALLRAAGDHGVVHAGLHPGGAGGAAVQNRSRSRRPMRWPPRRCSR